MAKHPVAWIDVIPQDQAHGDLNTAYETVKSKDGTVENLYLAMSQTPQAIQPADALYLALLHNPDNPLKPWLSELICTYVAILCECNYAAENHGANFEMYLGDTERAASILAALRNDHWDKLEDGQANAALRYTQKLSLTPHQMTSNDIIALRHAKFCDKSISYIIQLGASFAYWARMINGLGTQLGDHIGIQGILRAD
jgi:uncharacterized peroxidase-related enzyme